MKIPTQSKSALRRQAAKARREQRSAYQAAADERLRDFSEASLAAAGADFAKTRAYRRCGGHLYAPAGQGSVLPEGACLAAADGATFVAAGPPVPTEDGGTRTPLVEEAPCAVEAPPLHPARPRVLRAGMLLSPTSLLALGVLAGADRNRS